MNPQIIASSISRPVREALHHEGFTARIIGVFEHACNLVIPDGRVIALVLATVGNGPLNVVLDSEPGVFASLTAGESAELSENRLSISSLEINLENAVTWEPRPDWASLRVSRETILSNLPLTRDLALQFAPLNSLLALIGENPHAADHQEEVGFAFRAVVSTALSAATTLQQGWESDHDRLWEAGSRLAGLGSGLTPAGDDFLGGAMLWAWLTHPQPQYLCQILSQAAAPRTTTLSAAWLRAAARGECSAAWHTLLSTLTRGNNDTIASAIHQVLAHGASSGADTLAGFLWMWFSEKTPQKQ